MTTNDTAPRCPACGAPMALMHRQEFINHIAWECHNCNALGNISLTKRAQTHAYNESRPVPRCPMCEGRMHLVGNMWQCPSCTANDARVPCPACAPRDSDAPGFRYVAICTLCRQQRTVPPALAAAWTADGEREREE